MQEKNTTIQRGKATSRGETRQDKHFGKTTSEIQLWLWGKPIWKSVWPYLDPMDCVCLRTASMEWNEPGKYGPHGELFFFLIQKEPATLPVGETFSPLFNAGIRTSLVSADVPKMCALIALHGIAEDGRDDDECHVPGLGDEWKMDPKSPVWKSEGEAWSEDENVSSSGSREGNVCNDALRVFGLYGPGDKISLFLQDWELAQVALSCRMALDMLCQEMHGPWLLSLTVDGL